MSKEKWPFYVYEILGANKEVLYVGKGVRRRMYQSLRDRNGVEAVEVARFKKEKDAFAYEVERIDFSKPTLNVAKGGFGGMSTKPRYRAPIKDKWTKNFEAIGCKKYAALLWLKYAPVSMRSQSTVEQIREVAYG